MTDVKEYKTEEVIKAEKKKTMILVGILFAGSFYFSIYNMMLCIPILGIAFIVYLSKSTNAI